MTPPTDPSATCPAARHADRLLLAIAALLCAGPGVLLWFNALAPVRLEPRPPASGPAGWHWFLPAAATGRDLPRTAAEDVILPAWLRSQDWAYDQKPDRRNLALLLAGQTDPANPTAPPRRGSLKGLLHDLTANRFGGRVAMMRLGAWLKLYPLGVSSSPRVLLGPDDWLDFKDSPRMLLDAQRVFRFAPADLAAVVEALRRNRDHLADLGIPYLVVICPSKATIYPERLPGWLRPTSGPSGREQLLPALAAAGIEVLDLTGTCRAAREPAWRDAVREALRRRDPAAAADPALPLDAFQRTDTHWSDVGAFPAYQAIAGHLRDRWFPALQPLTLAEVSMRVAEPAGGDLTTFLYRRHDPRFMERLLELVPPATAGAVEEGVIDPLIDSGTGDPSLPTALVFRDSFGQRLIPYLSRHFGFVRYRWTNLVLSRHEVLVVERPWWLRHLGADVINRWERARGERRALLIRDGAGWFWRHAPETRLLSPDLDIAWMQLRADRPAIVIHQFSERWPVESPGAFGQDPDLEP
jgi:hypothetical protein